MTAENALYLQLLKQWRISGCVYVVQCTNWLDLIASERINRGSSRNIFQVAGVRSMASHHKVGWLHSSDVLSTSADWRSTSVRRTVHLLDTDGWSCSDSRVVPWIFCVCRRIFLCACTSLALCGFIIICVLSLTYCCIYLYGLFLLIVSINSRKLMSRYLSN